MDNNVVELFEKRTKQTTFDKAELELIGMQRVLDKQFDLIKHRSDQLMKAEAGAEHLEKKYDNALMKYAERKGVDNVGIVFLNYTTHCRLTYNEAGELEIKYHE
jgi:hypothetical protein